MSTDTRSARPGRWTLFRDILSFVGGWALTFHEVLRPDVRESVLILAGSLIAVPGAVAGTSALMTGRRAGTDGSPSDSPEAASPSSPS